MDQPAAMHTVSLYAFRFLLLALTAGPLAANEIRLEARFEKSEHSMDSNSTKETYKVSGPTLRYSYEYSGYHPDPGFERETTLRAWVDNAKTEKLLREKGLLKNLTREFPLKKDQPGRREILLELTIQKCLQVFAPLRRQNNRFEIAAVQRLTFPALSFVRRKPNPSF